ncbi:MAG: nitroreductase family deazaflavin-dependent oxidoreductase [Chloroflexi bacterium]|nr:nitroreductase family deazaflavin-dependent oxidoreductase [Chloroflexota bacterium]
MDRVRLIRQLILNAIVNPVVAAVLRSPFHRALSSRFLLLSFTGRVSGRRYTFPVDYRVDCHGLQVLTSRKRRWWRNFAADPRDVSVRYNGRRLVGTAGAITGKALVAGALSDRFGWSNERADSEAGEWVLLRIGLPGVEPPGVEPEDERETAFDNPLTPS